MPQQLQHPSNACDGGMHHSLPALQVGPFLLAEGTKRVPPEWMQVWLQPDRPRHAPQYGSIHVEPEQRRDGLLRILGGNGSPPAWPGVRQVGQDVRLHQVRLPRVSGGRAQHYMPFDATCLARLTALHA